MSWIPFTDQLEALINLYNLVAGFPQLAVDISTGVINLPVNLFYLICYPLVLIVNYAVSDINYVWWVFANLINVIIGIPNTAITIMDVLIPSSLDAGIIALVFIQLLIQVSIRSYAWIRHVKSWIPFWGN